MTVAHLYPNINPSLLLDFANVKALDPRITFTRASNASYYDNSGVLELAVNNQARFDHDPVTGQSLGLLTERQRTNLYLRSALFNASWNTTSATINTANSVSPNGLIEAAQVVSDVGSASGQIRQSTTKAANAITHTASVYAKTDGLETLSIQVEHSGNTSNRALVRYSLLDGSELITANTIGTFTNAVSSIHAVANSWFRISLTFTTGTETTIQTRISSGKISGTGDGTSGVYLWGAQLEVGPFPTSYIRTEASQVTRSADSASMTGTNFSSWYRQDEGTMFADYIISQVPSDVQGINVFMVTDNSFEPPDSFMQIRYVSDPIYHDATGVTLDVGQFDGSNYEVPPNTITKNILAYKTNDVAATVNGNTVFTDNTVTLPTVVRAFFGSLGKDNHVHIRKISYYPQRLTNTQLQALTR